MKYDSRIQVIERWYDRQNRSYHVLMKMPLKSNQSAVRQVLEKLVQQAETPPKRSIQQIIDQAFLELDQPEQPK